MGGNLVREYLDNATKKFVYKEHWKRYIEFDN